MPKTTKGKKLKASQKKEKGIFSWHLVVWPLLTWIGLSLICFGLDKLDLAERARVEWYADPGHWLETPHTVYEPIPGNPLEWAPLAWGLSAAIILYIVGIWIIYQYAKRHGRNVVRWTTAAITFSPVLAGIVYGLTWPKSR
jgi:hypothetical protein